MFVAQILHTWKNSRTDAYSCLFLVGGEPTAAQERVLNKLSTRPFQPVVLAIIQVTLASAYLGEASNVSALSGLIGDLVSGQVTEMVAGQNAEEIAGDYFRLSTGVYDAATVGGVQVS